jgi:hypothetical protein
MSSEKYIGYLESPIANTMWPSGLCREEDGNLVVEWRIEHEEE